MTKTLSSQCEPELRWQWPEIAIFREAEFFRYPQAARTTLYNGCTGIIIEGSNWRFEKKDVLGLLEAKAKPGSLDGLVHDKYYGNVLDFDRFKFGSFDPLSMRMRKIAEAIKVGDVKAKFDISKKAVWRVIADLVTLNYILSADRLDNHCVRETDSTRRPHRDVHTGFAIRTFFPFNITSRIHKDGKLNPKNMSNDQTEWVGIGEDNTVTIPPHSLLILKGVEWGSMWVLHEANRRKIQIGYEFDDYVKFLTSHSPGLAHSSPSWDDDRCVVQYGIEFGEAGRQRFMREPRRFIGFDRNF